jgi:phage portal protein BeeE
MAKTLSEKQYQQTAAFIDSVVEPKVKKIIEEVNKTLKAKGIRVGAEIQWYFDSVPEKDESNEDDN